MSFLDSITDSLGLTTDHNKDTNIVQKAILTRYATKKYDSSYVLSDEHKKQIMQVLRLTPSSVNSQPWQFYVADNKEAKEKILPGFNAANKEKVLDSAMTIIFAGFNQITDAHLSLVTEVEFAADRFANEQAREEQDTKRKNHIKNNNNQINWIDRQVYIAVGFLLSNLAYLELDSTAIEGIYPEQLDEILDLKNNNQHSLIAITIGKAAIDCFNAKLPKARISTNKIVHLL